MLHGEEEAKKAAAAAEAVFKGGGSAEGMPTFEVERAKLAAGYSIADALLAAGLVDSKGDAKRQIAGNAVKLNGDAVTDDKLTITEAALDCRRHGAPLGRQEASRASEGCVTLLPLSDNGAFRSRWPQERPDFSFPTARLPV